MYFQIIPHRICVFSPLQIGTYCRSRVAPSRKGKIDPRLWSRRTYGRFLNVLLRLGKLQRRLASIVLVEITSRAHRFENRTAGDPAFGLHPKFDFKPNLIRCFRTRTPLTPTWRSEEGGILSFEFLRLFRVSRHILQKVKISITLQRYLLVIQVFALVVCCFFLRLLWKSTLGTRSIVDHSGRTVVGPQLPMKYRWLSRSIRPFDITISYNN